MRKFFATLLAFGLTVTTFSQHLPDKDFNTWIAAQEAKSHENLFKMSDSKLGDNYDLKYHRMRWAVDPAVCYISGSVTSYFKAMAAMNQMAFELNQVMVVDSVKYHNANVSFTHTSNTFNVTLPSSISAGVLDSICVYYHGVPPQGGGFGSFIQNQHNGAPIIWTLSEPFGAPDWWPCKNSLSDKIDSIDVYVTVPNGNKVGSNGALVSETLAGGYKTFHWKHRYPIATYLIAIAVTNYSAYSDLATLQNGTLEILNYVFPEELTTAQASTPNLIPIIQLYDSLFSDYPYMNEKYGHAQFGWGGGMEHQTMTFLVNFGTDLMAHELSHQWFGDKVTCRSWHEIWINESFATFLTGLTYYFLSTNSAWHTWKLNSINSIVSQSNGSVYCDDTTSVNRIFDSRLSYTKGSMVLNMLRLKIGDSAMFTCMKNFMTDPQLIYGFAGTDDFIGHAEASSGLNLTEFFNDWIYGQGYPIYNISNTVYPDSSVHVVISQQQSDPSVSFFELPIPMRFSDGVHDTLILLDNTSNDQAFSVNLNFIPTQIVFDPENELIAVLDTCIVNVTETEANENLFAIYPNPATNNITIESFQNLIDKLQMFDLRGAFIDEIIPGSNSGSVSYDISSLKKGMYIIKIFSKDNIVMKRVVKF